MSKEELLIWIFWSLL